MKALDQLFECGICHTPFNLARSLSKHAELHHSQIEPKISQKMPQNEVGKKDQKTEIIEQQETTKNRKYGTITQKDVNKFPAIENEKIDQTFCMGGDKNESLVLQLELETTVLQNKIPDFEIENQEKMKLPNHSIEHAINITDPVNTDNDMPLDLPELKTENDMPLDLSKIKTENDMPLDLSKIKTENDMPMDLSKIKPKIGNIVSQLGKKTVDSDLGPLNVEPYSLLAKKKQFESKATKQVLKKEEFKDFEPQEPLETYIKPPQTIKSKENLARYAGKNFKCTMCNRVCASMQNLKGHMIKYHSEHFNCPKCFKSFALEDTNAFKLHLFKHEFVLTPRPNQCIHCGKKFAIHKILQGHMKKAGPFHKDECVQCPFKFITYEAYTEHIVKSHFGKWKFR